MLCLWAFLFSYSRCVRRIRKTAPCSLYKKTEDALFNKRGYKSVHPAPLILGPESLSAHRLIAAHRPIAAHRLTAASASRSSNS